MIPIFLLFLYNILFIIDFGKFIFLRLIHLCVIPYVWHLSVSSKFGKSIFSKFVQFINIQSAYCKLHALKFDKFNVFRFDRISECKGKTYTLYVENPDGDVEKTLGVGFSYEPKTEKGTELLINGNNVDGTLIAKTVTNRFDMETFCVVLLFVLYIVFFVKFLYRLFK